MNLSALRAGTVKLAIVQLACVVAIVASWQATAGRAAVSDQLLWLNLAVIGSVASGVVNGAWLLRLRRAVARRRQSVLGHLDESSAADREARATRVDEPLVAVAGMALVHRAGCALVAGKPVEPAAATGEPCGWCRP